MQHIEPEYESEHEFDKQKAQVLMHELNSFLLALNAFSKQFYEIEDFDTILILLKHILKIADDLCWELETWQIINLEHK